MSQVNSGKKITLIQGQTTITLGQTTTKEQNIQQKCHSKAVKYRY